MQKSIKRNLILATVVVVALAAVVIRCDRRAGGRRAEEPDNRKPFQSKCGTASQVATKVGKCLDPVFDLVEGRMNVPKGDEDLLINCERFNTSEKCIRNSARDCLSGGIHKTAVSSFASATKRFHTKECKTAAARAKYMDTTKCMIKEGKKMTAIYQNITGIAQAIRDSPELTPEEKILRVCCLLNSLDREIEKAIGGECARSTPVVIGIVHAMSEDVRSSLCVNPKCSGVLTKVTAIGRYQPPQNLIEPLMEILFTLG